MVEDLRPASEKVDKSYSFFIGSESYGIFRRGDKWVVPDPIRLFQHKIFEKYPDGSNQPDVKVHHLAVYQNSGSLLKRGVLGGIIGGVIGSAIASSTTKYGIEGKAGLTSSEEFNSFEEEYQRGTYTSEENPGNVSIYRVYFEAEIEGKRTFVTTVTPVELPNDDKRNSQAVAVETAWPFFWINIKSFNNARCAGAD